MSERINKSGINPAGHYVLVFPDPIEEKTDSGIILAVETVEQKRQLAIKGTLVAIGISAWKEYADGELWAKLGDRVICQMRNGINLKGNDGETYVLFNDQDILAVLND